MGRSFQGLLGKVCLEIQAVTRQTPAPPFGEGARTTAFVAFRDGLLLWPWHGVNCTMATKLDDFMREIEAEAQAEGPLAVAELEAFRAQAP